MIILSKAFLSVREFIQAYCDSFQFKCYDPSREHIFLDCGSNLGQGAKWFSKFFKPSLFKYYFIEPNPQCHEALTELIHSKAFHGSDHLIIKKALSIEDGFINLFGVTTLSDNNDPSLGCSINIDHNSGVDCKNIDHSITVPCISFAKLLRSLAKNNPNAVIVVKMDIESAEYKVLENILISGDAALIDYIYIEFHSQFMRADNLKNYAILEKRLMRSLSRYTNVRLWH